MVVHDATLFLSVFCCCKKNRNFPVVALFFFLVCCVRVDIQLLVVYFHSNIELIKLIRLLSARAQMLISFCFCYWRHAGA